jgi:hypothetical protein
VEIVEDPEDFVPIALSVRKALNDEDSGSFAQGFTRVSSATEMSGHISSAYDDCAQGRIAQQQGPLMHSGNAREPTGGDGIRWSLEVELSAEAIRHEVG